MATQPGSPDRQCRHVWPGQRRGREDGARGDKSKVKLLFEMLRASPFAHVQPNIGADARQ
jgi:hypothetical protein